MGPLTGVKIIEVGGIGPGPFCGMMLSDMGAEIVRVERKGGLALSDPKYDLLTRNRKSISINLRKPEGAHTLLRMLEQVDALQEGFRPGVMEKLGLGPTECMAANPRRSKAITSFPPTNPPPMPIWVGGSARPLTWPASGRCARPRR